MPNKMPPKSSLFPYFQPIICTASGRIVGYEALARQYDNNGQIISAGDLFASINSDNDAHLLHLDRQVRRQALERFSQLDSKAYLAINISASRLDQFDDFSALPTLQMLQELNIDKNRVIIEITESRVELKKLVSAVKEYRKHGLKVAVDDFGAGYSQLERVLAMRPDIIKLDMKFFKQAAKGGMQKDIIHLITRLSQRTASRIVCEGIETNDEFFYALSCGAQFMQGYLFSAAVPEFHETLHFKEQIGQLRKKFLTKTIQKEQKKVATIKQIKSLIDQLRKALESHFNLNELSAFPFEESGVLRFYLCDNQGNQISSNFNFSEGKWFEEHHEVGFNWSWRPYFYELLALEHVNDSYRIVTSEPYRDYTTSLLCKTMALRLDAERILLIDVVAEWL
ncbi:MAG: EAL domain-containing protein [Methylococcaceae bacterium]|jgi:EAL domain-containing protein (putative c-di-GMP-specific phosphodiesterase class I)